MEGDIVPVRFRESRSSAATLSGCSRPPQEIPGHLQKLLVPFHEDRTPEGSMAMDALKERRARRSVSFDVEADEPMHGRKRIPCRRRNNASFGEKTTGISILRKDGMLFLLSAAPN